MGLLGKIWVRLGLDNSEYKRGIQESQTATSKFKNFVKGVGAGILAAFSVRAVINFAKNSVKAYNEAQLAVAKLESQLRATNNAVGLSSKELQQYASDLQKTTMFGDETTVEAMAKMLSFSSIQGDVFKKAIASAQDMATILKTDLQSAVLQLGKALEDPNMGLTLLRRTGVIFTQEQIDHIRKLVDEGKKYEAQMLILAEVKKKFGGAAQAAADTAGGAWKQLGNAFGDLMETIGSGTEATKGFAKSLKDWVELLNRVFQSQDLNFWQKLTSVVGGNKKAFQIADAEFERNRKFIEAANNEAEARVKFIREMTDNDKALTAAEVALYSIIEKNKGVSENMIPLHRKLTEEKLRAIIAEREAAKATKETEAAAKAKALAEEMGASGSIKRQQYLIKVLQEQIDLETDPQKRAAMNLDLKNLEFRLRIMQMTTDELREYNALIKRSRENPLPAAPSAPSGITGAGVSSGIIAPKLDITGIDVFADELKDTAKEIEITSQDIAWVLTSSIGGAVDELVTSLMETGKVDTASVANALMQPFFDMAGQLGQVLIASGLGVESLMTIMTNPALAIAAGVALVALSAAASAAFSSAVNNRGRASSVQTDPYSYSGGMGNNVSLSASNMQVEVVGRISGQDIYLSNKRTEESKRR